VAFLYVKSQTSGFQLWGFLWAAPFRMKEKRIQQNQAVRVTVVICETWALQAAFIPAKAGIYSANLRKCAVDGLDSRFRGNDRRFGGSRS
jgi:hypothetical protein